MARQEKIHRAKEYIPIKGKSPFGEGEDEFHIGTDTIDEYLKHWPERFYALKGSNVTQVMLNPVAIFSGIRDYEEGGMCYIGVPTYSFTKNGEQRPAPPNMAFIVVLNSYNNIYEWRWIEENADSEDFPENLLKTRNFKELIWKR